MKKVLIFGCIVMICFSLQGCWGGWTDINAGKRPIDHNNSRWVSEDPDIYFEVSDDYREITGGRTYGKITIDRVVTEIRVSFDYGTTVQFADIAAYKVDENGRAYIDGNMWLFIGRCKFSEDKLVVTVINNNDFLDESIKKITFIKEEMSEEE